MCDGQKGINEISSHHIALLCPSVHATFQPWTGSMKQKQWADHFHPGFDERGQPLYRT